MKNKKTSMNVTVEDLSAVKKRITVTVPKSEVDAIWDKSVEKLRKTAQIDGFRPGKVPRSVIEKKFGSVVERETIEELVNSTFAAALEEKSLHPITNPLFDNVNFKKGEEFSYSAEFDTRPVVEISDKDYKGLKLKKKKVKISDKDVNEYIERLREMQAVLKPKLAGSKAEKGDVAVVDISGKIDGREDERLKVENHSLQIGAKLIYPEVDDALVGKSEGDSFTVKVKLSDKIKDKDLAGKEAELTVSVRALKRRVLPDLDDKFAESLGGPAKTLLELRGAIRKEMEEAAERETDEKLREDALSELTKKAKVELPTSLIERETYNLMERTARRMAANGMNPEKEMFTSPENMEKFKAIAEDNLKKEFILYKIAELEGMKISDEEIDRDIEKYASESGIPAEEIKKVYTKPEAREELRGRMLAKKALDFVLSEAKIN